MSTQTATFPPISPTPESDDYVVFHGNDALVVMSARDKGITLTDTLNCTQSTLLIYSELVFLNSPVIKVPGINLGIFCNKLVILGGSCCIDVSGSPGQINSSGSSIVNGARGGDSGAIRLYVEDPSFDFVTKLSLKAFGGDGGRGLSRTTGTEKGGNGGDGGSCGRTSSYTFEDLTDDS